MEMLIEYNKRMTGRNKYYVSVPPNFQYLLSTLELHSETIKNGKYLGYYHTKEEAQKAIDEFKAKYPEEFV